MKKFGITLGLILSVGYVAPLWAFDDPIDEPAKTSTPSPSDTLKQTEEKLITISLSPFLLIPVSGNTAKGYNVGGGAEVFIGYSADKNLLLGLDLCLQDV